MKCSKNVEYARCVSFSFQDKVEDISMVGRRFVIVTVTTTGFKRHHISGIERDLSVLNSYPCNFYTNVDVC